MRSFTLLVLLAVALVFVAFAPVASADTNITLYADSSCSQMLGDGPQNIPIPSSTTCQDMSGPTSSGSAIFYCYNQGGYNNLSLSVWMTASDCSGDADASITSYGKANTCALISINIAGQITPAYAQLQCSDTSMTEGRPMSWYEVAPTLNAAKRQVMPQLNQKRSAGRLGSLRKFNQ